MKQSKEMEEFDERYVTKTNPNISKGYDNKYYLGLGNKLCYMEETTFGFNHDDRCADDIKQFIQDNFIPKSKVEEMLAQERGDTFREATKALRIAFNLPVDNSHKDS